MNSAHCIVCERTARWAIALRPPLRRLGVRLYETRALEECWREVEAHTASMVGVEVTRANLKAVVPWLTRLSRAFPRARVVACVDRELEPAQWLLREAGAVHVTSSPRETAPLVRLIVRHLAASPAGAETARQRIWQRLPWSDEEWSAGLEASPQGEPAGPSRGFRPGTG